MASYQCLLRFFHSICVKCCACHEKVMPVARSYEVLHLSRKIILADLTSWCSKMQPFSGDQRPDLLTSLMNMSLVLRLPREMHLCRSSSNVPRLPLFLKMLQNPHVLIRCRIPCDCPTKPHLNLQKWSEHVLFLIFWLPNVLRALFRHVNFQKRSDTEVFCTFWHWNVLRATTACTFSSSQLPKVGWTISFLHFWLRNVLRVRTACAFSTSQLPKVVRSWCVLYILTSKCASCHNCVHFFDISTSKSGPELVCFLHFVFEMCFAPQRRALFPTSQLPKVVRTWCVLYILTWKCASRHNSVQCFISHLASWLRTRRFSKPPFIHSGGSNHWKKHSVSRLSYLFAHLDLLSSETFSFLIFFLLSSFFFLLSSFFFSSLPFSSLLFSSLFFSSLLFSDSSHLCFSICPYCRKFDF